MQVCKTVKSFFRIGTSGILLFFSSLLYAESIEMPTMPEMPTITAPALDGKFYTPSMPWYGKKTNNENTQNSANGNSAAVLSDGTTNDDLISSFLSSNTNLTANDISTLYDSGLFSTISSLTGIRANSSENNSNSEVTNQLLQKVLKELEELKTEQRNYSAAEKKSLSNYQQDSQTFKHRDPSILRFKLNGYSMTESFTKVFFSEPEPDGTFLLSADRKYFANQKAYEETLYIMFRAVKSTGSTVVYNVQPTVVQTDKNENSFIYRLGQMKNLTAEKTGNLVVLRSEQSGFTADLLLDIDYKAN